MDSEDTLAGRDCCMFCNEKLEVATSSMYKKHILGKGVPICQYTERLVNLLEAVYKDISVSGLGELLKYLKRFCSEGHAILEAANIVFHYERETNGRRYSKLAYNIPRRHMWCSKFPMSHTELTDFVSRYRALDEVLELETKMQRADYIVIEKVLDKDASHRREEYKKVVQKICQSDEFWKQAERIWRLGELYLTLVSTMATSDCTLGKFKVAVTNACTEAMMLKDAEIATKKDVNAFLRLGEVFDSPEHLAAAMFDPQHMVRVGLTYEDDVNELKSFFERIVEKPDWVSFDKELQMYLGTDIMDNSHNPAMWWSNHGVNIPTLAKYAIPVLSLSYGTHIANDAGPFERFLLLQSQPLEAHVNERNGFIGSYEVFLFQIYTISDMLKKNLKLGEKVGWKNLKDDLKSLNLK